jgi:hypothetical protein
MIILPYKKIQTQVIETNFYAVTQAYEYKDSQNQGRGTLMKAIYNAAEGY